MAFKELTEALEAPSVEIPLRGKVYSFPGEISARAWLLVQKVGTAYAEYENSVAEGKTVDLEAEVLSDAEEVDLQKELFAGVDKELADDGATSTELKLVYGTLMVYHLMGQEQAEAFWASRGEAPAPSRAARRASKAPAKSTQPRGSHAG